MSGRSNLLPRRWPWKAIVRRLDAVNRLMTAPRRLLGGTARSSFERHAALMRQLHGLFRTFPAYESMIERAYRTVVAPGDTVIDVGAHGGRHTVPLSDLVGETGTVLAFEPLPDLAGVLRSRLFKARVKVFECALSDFSAQASFIHARGTRHESGLKARIYNDPASADPVAIDVEVRRLDEFLGLIDRLSFVKIDIEGAELSCLRGGTAVIRRFRPVISVEYGHPSYSVYGETNRSLFDFAEAFDYRIGDVFGGVCPDLATWLRVCDTAFWDYLLIPRERCDGWDLAD